MTTKPTSSFQVGDILHSELACYTCHNTTNHLFRLEEIDYYTGVSGYTSAYVVYRCLICGRGETAAFSLTRLSQFFTAYDDMVKINI
jgi:hypothetical protein